MRSETFGISCAFGIDRVLRLTSGGKAPRYLPDNSIGRSALGARSAVQRSETLPRGGSPMRAMASPVGLARLGGYKNTAMQRYRCDDKVMATKVSDSTSARVMRDSWPASPR